MRARKSKRVAVTGILAAVLVIATASPAFALSRVGCGDVSDGAFGTKWFRIYEKFQRYPKMCFKDRGELNVWITDIDQISTGNNDGWFEEYGGKRTYFGHYQNFFLGGGGKITKMHFGP